jgi:hypothetical protein
MGCLESCMVFNFFVSVCVIGRVVRVLASWCAKGGGWVGCDVLKENV